MEKLKKTKQLLHHYKDSQIHNKRFNIKKNIEKEKIV